MVAEAVEANPKGMTMTVTDSVIDVEGAVARYFDAWNEPDPAARAVLVAAAWAPDARSVDPLADVAGHDAISAMVGAVHEQFAGMSVRRCTGIDVHHDRVRFGWEILTDTGETLMAGIDIARLDEHGRLAELVGFFGDLNGL